MTDPTGKLQRMLEDRADIADALRLKQAALADMDAAIGFVRSSMRATRAADAVDLFAPTKERS